MRAQRIAAFAAIALAGAGAMPAAAQAGSWSAARAATDAGTATAPSVAADAGGRVALGFARTYRGEHRAEVRLGTLRRGLRGASVVLDRGSGFVGDVTVSLDRSLDGPLVAWRRPIDRAQRLRATFFRDDGRPASPVTLTSGTESAYEPRFLAGGDGALRLVYDRRTSSAFRAFLGTQSGFESEQSLPGTGVSSQPGLAVAADGRRTAVWLAGGAVLTADGAPGAAFGTPVALPSAGYARDVQLVQAQDGGLFAAWLASTGQGNIVEYAVRPPGAAAFGPTSTLGAATPGAFSPRLVATSAGEVLLGWTATNRRVGYSGGPGALRLQRLRPDGAAVGPTITLTAPQTRADEVVLAHDGTGSVLAAWGRWDGGGRRTIQARRIAPGGIVGTLRTLSPRAGAVAAPALAGAQGGAVAAWQSPGQRIVTSIYR
jgi:hypothetical protein